jgi:hypothetical protein
MTAALLFDISPEEPERKKTRPARKKSPEPAKQHEPEFRPDLDAGFYEIMGQVHGLHECADERCKSRNFDIIDEWRGEWRIECMVCGTGQRVPVVPGILKEEDEFRFRDGIFAGLSIDEASRQENGPEYIAWAAESHKRKAVKEACASWLDSKRKHS